MSEGKAPEVSSPGQRATPEPAAPILRLPPAAGERPGYLAWGADECFRALVEAAGDHAVCLLDPEGRVAAWNRGAERLHGYRPEEILGHPFARLFAPRESRRGGPEHWLEAARMQERLDEECWQVRKSGARFRARIVLAALRGEGGQPRGFSLVTRDVTAHRRAEEALGAAEERYRAVAEGSFQGVVIYQDGIIRHANQSAADILGYVGPEELIGRVAAAPSEEPPRPVEAADLLRRLATPGRREWQARRGDGGRVWVRSTVGTVSWAGRLALAAFLHDITELKRAEEALTLRDQALTALPQPVFLMDASRLDNPLVYANPALERLTGFSFAELIRRGWRLFGDADSGALTRAGIEAAFRESRAWSGEVLVHGKDGTARRHELALHPVPGAGGRTMRFVGLLTSLAERGGREELFLQVQRMDVIGRLAVGLAHDLNNLLMAVLGWCDLLLPNTLPGDPVREGLTEIRRGAETGASLTRSLLSLGRRQAPRPQALDLAAVVTKVERLLRGSLGPNIELFMTVEPGLGCVRADRGQVEQVLLNLALNARDAMPQGGRLTIELANAEGPAAHVRLAVADTGLGMSAEVLERIFEPFFTTKGPGKGTGLGLFTVHEIVKQSGGEVRVSSRPGEGTRFEVYLPRDEHGLPPAEDPPSWPGV